MPFFTCILTLAVSRGNVTRSAKQAAVPAVSNFIPREVLSCAPGAISPPLVYLGVLLFVRPIKISLVTTIINEKMLTMFLAPTSLTFCHFLGLSRFSSPPRRCSIYSIYKVLPEDVIIQYFIKKSAARSRVNLRIFRFPEVIGVSVQPFGPRALVFYFLAVDLFIHTILLQHIKNNKQLLKLYQSQLLTLHHLFIYLLNIMTTFHTIA